MASNEQQLPQTQRRQDVDLTPQAKNFVALASYRGSFGLRAANDAEWKQFGGRFAELMVTNAALAGANMVSQIQIARQIWDTGLWPGATDGEAYVVEYGKAAKYVIGPRGWESLLYRSGARIVVTACNHEGDTFSPGSLIPPVPATLIPSGDPDRSGKPFTHCVGYVEWNDGQRTSLTIDTSYLKRVVKASPAGSKNVGPWVTWPEQMAAAKVLRLIARGNIRRAENEELKRQIQAAIETDNDNARDEDDAAPAAPEKPTEPPPVTTKARGSRAKKTEASPAGEAPPTSPAANSGPSSDAASASAGPAGDPAPETLESLVDRALKARPTEGKAKYEFETTYEGVSLHAVSIRRAIGGPFETEAAAREALIRFIG